MRLATMEELLQENERLEIENALLEYQSAMFESKLKPLIVS